MLKSFALILILLWPLSGHAADHPEKPDLWFCIKARAAVVAAGSEKAAEDTARAQGVSEATIRAAKRCSR
jgi:hypothetical protein